jgi:signal transduction histidine kinase
VLERRSVIVVDMLEAIGPPAPGKDWPSPEDWAIVQKFAERFQTVLALPLIARDEALGALVLYYRQRRILSEEEIELAGGVAHQAALAIESARLREQAGRAAATAERSRLARELHDSVTQSLYSVTLYGEAAARLLTDGRAAEAAEHLRELRDTAQEALREMRLLIFQLRPPALERSGLVGALQARLEAVELRGGTQAELDVDGAECIVQVPLTIQEEVYHIAQEAMNNVLRHAKAEHVWLRLSCGQRLLSVEVRDDGYGFAPQQAGAGGGLGLPGMRERAERIDATLEIESRPGEGTRIRLQVPFQPPRLPSETRPSGDSRES